MDLGADSAISVRCYIIVPIRGCRSWFVVDDRCKSGVQIGAEAGASLIRQ